MVPEHTAEISEVMAAFGSYISQSTSFDILFSEKFGYILITEEEIQPFVWIKSEFELLSFLFQEVICDVVSASSNKEERKTEDISLEKILTEGRIRVAEYLRNTKRNQQYLSYFDQMVKKYQVYM